VPTDERISLSEAARRAGVSPATLKRWAEERVLPVRRGRWTAAAAAQARVVARMRERGHSLDDLKRAGREGRLAFGFTEDLFPKPEEQATVEQVAAETGLEPKLIERILVILGSPLEGDRPLGPQDVQALRHCARVLAAGFPLAAFLQLVRVYAQSLRRIADAEVRLFHLYVHEPLIRDGVPELEMAEEMGDLAEDLLPLASPLIDYLHTRYLRFYLEQDVIGHMETDLDDEGQVAKLQSRLKKEGVDSKLRSMGAQVGDDVRVVHDLVTHVDRRAVLDERALDDLDGAIHAGTETARLGQQHLADHSTPSSLTSKRTGRPASGWLKSSSSHSSAHSRTTPA